MIPGTYEYCCIIPVRSADSTRRAVEHRISPLPLCSERRELLFLKGYVYTYVRTGTRGIFGGRTERTKVWGTGIDVVPNLPKCRIPCTELGGMSGAGIQFVRNDTGVFGRVFRPCRTTSAG